MSPRLHDKVSLSLSAKDCQMTDYKKLVTPPKFAVIFLAAGTAGQDDSLCFVLESSKLCISENTYARLDGIYT